MLKKGRMILTFIRHIKRKEISLIGIAFLLIALGWMSVLQGTITGKTSHGTCPNRICDSSEQYTTCPQDCSEPVCNNNNQCEGSENGFNCPSDCPGLGISPEFNNFIVTNWENQKLKLTNNIVSMSTKRNPQVLYNTQRNTNTLLEYAANVQNVNILEELAALYLGAFEHLEEVDTYRYYKAGSPYYEILSLPQNTKMWVDDSIPAHEDILSSSQFLYAVSRMINILVSLPPDQRTKTMEDFIATYAPVVKDHYERWIFSDKIFGVIGWGCIRNNAYVYDRFNHFTFLQKKRQLELGGNHNYCNAITDVDTWIIAGVVEMIAAHEKSPALVSIESPLKEQFRNYAQMGVDLLESRSKDTVVVDFAGNSVEGMILDPGAWDDYYENDYAGYTGDAFPTSEQKTRATNSGWDTSHGSRLVNVFNTLHRNRNVIGRSFPDEKTMKKMANHFAYAVFNKDFEMPLFTNYMDGTNGWYRIGYVGRTGYGFAPFDASQSALEGGWGLWSSYNQDIGKVMTSLWKLITTTAVNNPQAVSFINRYYAGNGYSNHVRTTATLDTNPHTSLPLLLFMASFSADITKVPSVELIETGTVFNLNEDVQEKFSVNGILYTILYQDPAANFARIKVSKGRETISLQGYTVGSSRNIHLDTTAGYDLNIKLESVSPSVQVSLTKK